MKKFSIRVDNGLKICYNHYLSDDFIKGERGIDGFKRWYPFSYNSRKFDKPAAKLKNGDSAWWLDDNPHRVGKPAIIYNNGKAYYYENGEEVR